MDFSEIGVTSRKTGLRAKENVKRDANNMEDVDDFFKDDTIIHNNDSKKGRIIFPPSSRPTTQDRTRNSPLRSPLPSSKRDQDDLFTDAHEQPMNIDSNQDDDMDIDDELKGAIKINNELQDDQDDYDISFDFNGEDINRVPLNNSPIKTSGGEKLFNSSSDDESYNIKSKKQRQLELERNTTVRSTSNKSLLKPYHLSATPKYQEEAEEEEQREEEEDHNDENHINESPLRSILNSPLQPSSRKIASASKNIALNKQRHKKPIIEDSDSEDSNYSDSDSEDNDYYNEEGTTQVTDGVSYDSIDETTLNPRISDFESDDSDEDYQFIKKSNKRNLSPKNPRRNKFQRNSPTEHQHVVNINELKNQQLNSNFDENSTRRSSRVKIPPLAFWRNERAVFEKNKNDIVPTIKEIITVDEPTEKTSRNSTRKSSRANSKTRIKTFKKLNPVNESDEEVNENNEDELKVQNGELKGSEWLKNGFLKVDTFEGHGSDIKSNRLIAWGPGTENYSNSIITKEDNFKLAILFDKNREFIAAGMMSIPPNGVKSLKSTDTTYFVFYCISGIIEVTLSGNVFLIKKGCSLEIPMGNFYQFINKGKNDATLFFVQTRGHEVDEWGDDD